MLHVSVAEQNSDAPSSPCITETICGPIRLSLFLTLFAVCLFSLHVHASVCFFLFFLFYPPHPSPGQLHGGAGRLAAPSAPLIEGRHPPTAAPPAPAPPSPSPPPQPLVCLCATARYGTRRSAAAAAASLWCLVCVVNTPSVSVSCLYPCDLKDATAAVCLPPLVYP